MTELKVFPVCHRHELIPTSVFTLITLSDMVDFAAYPLRSPETYFINIAAPAVVHFKWCFEIETEPWTHQVSQYPVSMFYSSCLFEFVCRLS